MIHVRGGHALCEDTSDVSPVGGKELCKPLAPDVAANRPRSAARGDILFASKAAIGVRRFHPFRGDSLSTRVDQSTGDSPSQAFGANSLPRYRAA